MALINNSHFCATTNYLLPFNNQPKRFKDPISIYLRYYANSIIRCHSYSTIPWYKWPHGANAKPLALSSTNKRRIPKLFRLITVYRLGKFALILISGLLHYQSIPIRLNTKSFIYKPYSVFSYTAKTVENIQIDCINLNFARL